MKLKLDPGYIMMTLLFLAVMFFLGLGAAAIFMYGVTPTMNILAVLAIYGCGVVMALLTIGAGVCAAICAVENIDTTNMGQ